MDRCIAHNIQHGLTTTDVQLRKDLPFSKLMFSSSVLRGLRRAGFEVPTQIQAMAIPVGRMGVDMLVQSKSGTGKTLIFATILMEMYQSKIWGPQALILVPTREIAIQVQDVISKIGVFCQNFSCVYTIGGISLEKDRRKLQTAKAIVGTPGRTLHLILNNILNVDGIKLLVLDEADQLYSLKMKSNVIAIQRLLRDQRQTIACSATISDELSIELSESMYNPLVISTNEKPTLLVGIKQFVYDLPEPINTMQEMKWKLQAISYIFSCVPFKQCVIFAGSQIRADSYCNSLEKDGWPTVQITGAQNQKTRMEIFNLLRDGKTRIVVSTDLFSRGIDCENINLIINVEVPSNEYTYLHRIGRAGRFGTYGIAINIVSGRQDLKRIKHVMSAIGRGMTLLNFPKKGQLFDNYDFWNFKQLHNEIEIFGLFGETKLSESAQNIHKCKDMQSTQNENSTICNLASAINTETFRVNSKDDALNRLNIENSSVCLKKNAKSGSHQTSQQLPSSNTIDDASSIAPDSEFSSVQSMNSRSVSSIIHLIVDINDLHTSNIKFDFYEDYKRCLGNFEEYKKVEEERFLNASVNLSSILVDDDSTGAKANKINGDLYSEYIDFNITAGKEDKYSSTNCKNSLDTNAKYLATAAKPSETVSNSLLHIETDLVENNECCLAVGSNPILPDLPAVLTPMTPYYKALTFTNVEKIGYQSQPLNRKENDFASHHEHHVTCHFGSTFQSDAYNVNAETWNRLFNQQLEYILKYTKMSKEITKHFLTS